MYNILQPLTLPVCLAWNMISTLGRAWQVQQKHSTCTEESGEGEQAHGNGLRGSNGIYTLRIQEDNSKILAL